MASIRSLLSERKRPFFLALAFFLALVVLVVHLSSSAVPSFLSSYSISSSSSSSRIDYSQRSPPPPPSLRASIPLPRPPPPSPPVASSTGPSPSDVADNGTVDGVAADDWSRGEAEEAGRKWEICKGGKGFSAVDYIPCLDNVKAIKELKSRRHMEHRERHCPRPSPRCLVPLPEGYRVRVPWPKSRNQIWFNNVPHTKLVDYKKDQNWVRISGDYLVFPGGGTQFKEGVTHYIQFIEKTLPTIEWGGRTRVIMDVGCGVASFGGYLMDKGVITMSFAPKDEHEAQIQFALERGIPAVLSVIGTQKLPFPDNSYDLIHCARCRVHWDGDGGKPLLELNRILRPGGFFIWSATPVYRVNTRDQEVWNAMVALTDSFCWKTVVKSTDAVGIGLVIYQKPFSSSCYKERRESIPPLCDSGNYTNITWYAPLDGCLQPLPEYNSGDEGNWPTSWPQRLVSRPLSIGYQSGNAEEHYHEDTKHWSTLVSNIYQQSLGINWSGIRNVMDMNAGYGGFASSLVNQPLWVMNVIPVQGPDTLPVIFDRGLIGIYHDWCESFNTYPRTYDLLHSSYLFGNITHRCEVVDVVVEIDRILRPGGWVLVQDTEDIIWTLLPIFHSLHWDTNVHDKQFLVAKKGFWRPSN